MKKAIAFFDFDGTVTSKDTMLEFLQFLVGRRKYYTNMLALTPTLMSLSLRLLTNQKAKENMLELFIGGRKTEEINASGAIFSREVLPQLIRRKALNAIELHQQNNEEVVIVSASADNWLKDWCNDHSLTLIATRLEEKDGKLTGKISGLNCHGQEKVQRIRSSFQLSSYDSITCYGDTKGDLPMLSLGTKSFYKPFQ